MENNYFDNFIREKMQDHESPVPAGLWDKVNPATNAPTGKVIKLHTLKNWGLSAVLLLAGLGSSFVVADSKRYTIGAAGNTVATSTNGMATTTTQEDIVTQAVVLNETNNSITRTINTASPIVQSPILQASESSKQLIISNQKNSIGDNNSSKVFVNETVAKFAAANTISFVRNNNASNFKFGSKDYNKYLNDLKCVSVL
jgi:hypothetical protein